MKMTAKEYSQLADKTSPPTRSVANCIWAFIVGGLICVLGEGVRMLALNWGVGEEESFVVAAIVLILIAVLLTGLNIYDKIASKAGAGSLVPITGFANAVCAPAMEFKTEGMVLGLAAKMFIIAGPVIVYGITASWIYGLIIYIFKLY